MSVERKPRVPLKLQVIYDDGQSFMSGPVIDISETGLFIETVMPLPPGTLVRLTPLVSDAEAGLDFEGEVVRGHRRGAYHGARGPWVTPGRGGGARRSLGSRGGRASLRGRLRA